jgi:hypothetical protein
MVSSTNKTDRHDILTEILLKMALHTITPTSQYEPFMHIRVLLVEETADLPQVTDKMYHIMLYTSP